MTKTQNAPAAPVSIRVTASTDNENDEGYQHCFEQKEDATLFFEVYTKAPVETIHFVLWNMHNPVKPRLVESCPDCPIQNGHATITVKHPLDEHLGPGPYCATLTAASSSEGAGKIVANAVYYYDTWKDSPPYDWPV